MLIDSHTHLNDSRFSPDRAEVLQRARASGVCAMVNVGYDLASSQLAVAMAAQLPGVFAAVGVHPHDASEVDAGCLQEIADLATAAGVVAVGETGLDYYRNLSPPPVQRRVFEQFIGLAAELRRPLIVHCREAREDTLRAVDACLAPGQPVVMHCFDGDRSFAEECLLRGFHLGFAGTITYPKSVQLREVAATTPPERLLVETDCPWLPPQPHRGQRNEPAYVQQVAAAVAEARGEPLEHLARLTSANARRFFALPEEA